MLRAKYLTKITDINKMYIEKLVKKGDIVVDATMGNGYDTLYLAKIIGEEGFLYSFDIQKEALISTKEKLEKENLLSRTKLILDGHENIDIYIDKQIDFMIFNLGYLPKGDHNIITKPHTTIEAIKKGMNLLKPNGIISIAIYSGHEGGAYEKNELYKFLTKVNQEQFNVLSSSFINQINNPPDLILIEKKG